MNEAKTVRVFLLACGVGLIPIALGYGAVPTVTMGQHSSPVAYSCSASRPVACAVSL